ncbi:MAG: glycosyltransferase [Gammaproteobacteria bacterium]|nr:glycosyltransferase [Gammaproteobacteria bacterium]
MTLAVKAAVIQEYLGMRVITVRSTPGTIFRPLLNLKKWFDLCRELDADVFILRNPDTTLLAFLLRATGRNVIYDTHEDFSKRPMIRDISPAFVKPLLAKLITLLEKLLARSMNAVLVTQAQQVEGLGARTVLQPNAPLLDGPIIDELAAIARRQKCDIPTIVYVGEITENRGLWPMLDLIERTNTSAPCVLRIAGWFESEQLQRAAESHPGWRHVDFVGKVSHAEALGCIRDSDIALALLAPVADYPTCSITKLFEYMQFGVPFVASDFAAWRLPKGCKAPGLYVDPNSPDAILASMARLLDDAELRKEMSVAGSEYVRNQFNWEHLAPKFIAIVTAAKNGEVLGLAT